MIAASVNAAAVMVNGRNADLCRNSHLVIAASAISPTGSLVPISIIGIAPRRSARRA
jgi:hypothetical protein